MNIIQTPLKQFTLRPATEADVPLILSFIKELAEYEKLLHEVVATEDLLSKNLFGEQKVAEAIIGEWDGQSAIGAKPMDEWTVQRMACDELKALAEQF